jgi:ATP-dependent Lhr-like helicase
MDAWLGRAEREPSAGLSADASRVLAHLQESGASFFTDIVRGTGLLPTRAEVALGELVSRGRTTSDGFAGLRALLIPESRRRGRPGGGRHGRGAQGHFALENAGRWSTIEGSAGDVERVAHVLLGRWGVVFHRVLDRESGLPPWRDLLRVYRRLEARGEIRGGRFVEGFTGEQYALPEAVGALRKCRRAAKDGQLVSISAADPLNLVGILTPGARLPALAKNRLLLRDGLPIAVREGSEVRFLEAVARGERWRLETLLTQRKVPAQVRAYLGSAG